MTTKTKTPHLDELADHAAAISEAQANLGRVRQENRELLLGVAAAERTLESEVARVAREGTADGDRREELTDALHRATIAARYANPGALPDKQATVRVEEAQHEQRHYIVNHVTDLLQEIEPDALEAAEALRKGEEALAPVRQRVEHLRQQSAGWIAEYVGAQVGPDPGRANEHRLALLVTWALREDGVPLPARALYISEPEIEPEAELQAV